MRLYSYIVKHDTGLAPNPFWDYCTLAVCTPNHMGIKPEKKDWVVGFLSKERENRLLYAMKISEVLCFDGYYKDPRFKKKIPNSRGNWKQRCGDNFYYLNKKGDWVKHQSDFHEDQIEKDIKHPFVFISEHFYYFGDKAKIAKGFEPLIINRCGVKCDHDQRLVDKFIRWLNKPCRQPGIQRNAQPLDNPHRNLSKQCDSVGNNCLCK